MTSEEFVAAMNALAISLGMMHTHFADPTGLDPRNMSTAAEYSVLLKTAFDHQTIADVISKKNYAFKPINGRRIYSLHNTNRLLFGKQNIIGGKTGFIGEAGYCLAFGVEDAERQETGGGFAGRADQRHSLPRCGQDAGDCSRDESFGQLKSKLSSLTSLLSFIYSRWLRLIAGGHPIFEITPE